MTTGRRATFAFILAALLAVIGGASRAEAATVPYSDPAATGSIALCDQSGKPVTSGSVLTQPFVSRAVSSMPPPTGYSGPGAKATLFAFQPRPNVAPELWNGDTLTAASTYSNPAVPMAEATRLDFRLKDYLDEYPTLMDGLVQLRLYSGIADRPTYTTAYPALNLRVSGDTWSIVGAAAPDLCSAGHGTSSEVGIVPALNSGSAQPSSAAPGSSSTGTPVSGASTTGSPPASAAPGGSGTDRTTSSANPSGSTGESGSVLAATSSHRSSSSSPVIGIALAAVAVAGIVAFFSWRRYRRIG